jgi:hypothetical protein
MMLAVLRVIIWVVTGLLGAIVIAVGSVFLVDTWRASGVHPDGCDSPLLYPARGDLRADEDVLSRAWAALVDPQVQAGGDLYGSRPVLNHSCLLYAGRGTAGDTVVYADTTVAGRQSLVRVAEVRLPREPGGSIQRAVASHSTLIGSELVAGVLLPLSGAYLAPGNPGEVTGVRVLSATDGYANATPAEEIGEGLFDVGVAPDRTLAPDSQGSDVDALLALDASGLAPHAVALPTGPRTEGPPPARAAFLLGVDGTDQPDELALSRIGPALSLMSADARFSLVRDRTTRPPALTVSTGPTAIVIVPTEPFTPAGVLPVFTQPVFGQQPI